MTVAECERSLRRKYTTFAERELGRWETPPSSSGPGGEGGPELRVSRTVSPSFLRMAKYGFLLLHLWFDRPRPSNFCSSRSLDRLPGLRHSARRCGRRRAADCRDKIRIVRRDQRANEGRKEGRHFACRSILTDSLTGDNRNERRTRRARCPRPD